jgi:hypothetical protein
MYCWVHQTHLKVQNRGMEEAWSLIYVILDLDSFKFFWIVTMWGFIEDKNSKSS